MKRVEKEAALLMRAEGYSMKEISDQLSVAKSTVSRWVSGVKLDSEKRSRLDNKRNCFSSTNQPAKRNGEYYRNQRLKYQEEGRLRAKSGNLLHVKACMLYWAEGSKNQVSCKICNTDPFMLKLFVRFLVDEFDVDLEKIGMYVCCYLDGGLTLDEIEKYWLDTLGLTKNNVKKHQIRAGSSNKSKKHPYGICYLSINDVRIVQHIYGAIQEYGNFDNNYCIDV